MRVLRIEYNGEGIFRSGLAAIDRAIHIACKKKGVDRWPELEDFSGSISPYRHPTPSTDVPAWDSLTDTDPQEAERYFCGFKSLHQLLVWFDSEALRVAMNEVGCEVIEFEVDEPNVMQGRAQIMFLKDAATEVARHKMPTAG